MTLPSVWTRWRTAAPRTGLHVGPLPVVATVVTVLLVGRLADPIPGTETAVLLLDLATAAGVLLAYYRLIPGVILAGAGYTAAAVMVVPTVTFLLAAIPPLLAGIRGNTRTRLWTTLWYVPVVSAPQALFGGPEAVDLVILPVQNVLLFGTAWLVGDVIRRQRSEIARLDQERELAVRAERLAIARDLHDAVASANARIVMRAEQAKLRGTPDAATAADLDHILTTARQAGQDLRAMLATLRSSVDGTPIDAPPSPPDPPHTASPLEPRTPVEPPAPAAAPHRPLAGETATRPSYRWSGPAAGEARRSDPLPTIAVAAAVFVLARWANSPTVAPWVIVTIDVVTCLALVLAYYRPVPGAIVMGLVQTATTVTGLATLTVVLTPGVPLLAGMRGRPRLRVWSTAWLAPLLLWQTFVTLGLDVPRRALLAALATATLFGMAWLMGDVIRHQRSEIGRLDQERDLAVRAERLAIARDLHDAVAEATARVAMRADQATLRGVPDPKLETDFAYIGATARQAGQDLRSMLAALRSSVDATPLDTAPTGWHIASLTDTLDDCATDLRRAGFTVEVAASFDEDSLARTGRDALGKVLIEATSNVAKYADPTGPCRFLIDQDSTGIELLVISRRHPHDHRNPNDPTTSSGFGLTGARERLVAVGGELDTTATPRDWIVRVHLPH